MTTDAAVEQGDRIIRWSDGRLGLQVDGHEVPYVDGHETGDEITLVIRRPGCGPLLALTTSEDEALKWAPFLANAMAVSAGRTSHGFNSRPLNPHGACE